MSKRETPPDFLKIPVEQIEARYLCGTVLTATAMKNAWARTEKKLKDEMERRASEKKRRATQGGSR